MYIYTCIYAYTYTQGRGATHSRKHINTLSQHTQARETYTVTDTQAHTHKRIHAHSTNNTTHHTTANNNTIHHII